MAQSFVFLDWFVTAAYIALLFIMAWVFSKRKSENSREYFLGGNTMPYWVVAISVLATSQSAATFLGGPDQGYRSDFTYLSTNIGTIIAAIFVARVLIPKFYQHKVTTVYELLAIRFSANTMRAAGGMYLIGRVFASGSRLFLAAIAVSMILFSNIDASSIVIAAFLMMALGFLITFLGGINSVIWSDLIQFLIYTIAALSVLFILWNSIPADTDEIMTGLRNTPEGINKLQFFNWDMDFSAPFAMISVVTGLTLLGIGSFGLDQDMTQRVLTCKNANEGGRALLISAIVAIPVIWIFVSIGELLYVFYERPDLMGADVASAANSEFNGEKITVFMHYILRELPAGIRGLVTVGVVAAAVSTINSGLNSMSSVIVEDFYRPWRESQGQPTDKHFVRAGQIFMGVVGIALFLMSVLCFYWQQYSDTPLLDFALSVMVFSYSGLLGVYFTVIFTRRGSPRSVMLALAVGFLVTLVQQPYIVDTLGLPESWKGLAFSWKLCIGTAIAFLVCLAGNNNQLTKRSAA
ncbi:sodium:solute symporter [Robiginitomaculum antarcticum]|uniref:sodium:solute symporter n=1 Tax=Robiginitomaculum antarcticum TaxID=437507 RepID=UPI000372ED6D|nr:sodium:solute symporter [Robiginitomaculum antarcticum]